MLETHEPYCLKTHEALIRAQSHSGLVDLEAEVIQLRTELEETEEDFEAYRTKMENQAKDLRFYLDERERELEEIKEDPEWEHENYLMDLIDLPGDIYDALSAEASRTGEIERLSLRITELESEVENLREIKESKEEEESAFDEAELRKAIHPAYGVVVGVEKRKLDQVERAMEEEEEGPEYKARIVKWFP